MHVQSPISIGGPRASRELVHKAEDGEVFLADVVRLGEHRFVVAALWGRDHWLGHRGVGGVGDPLLLAEVVRQAGIYLSHRYAGVPLGYAFILQDLRIELTDDLPAGGPEADRLVLEISCEPVHQGRRAVMTLEAEVIDDGRSVGSVRLHWQAVDRRQYEALRLRGGGSVTPVAGCRSAVPDDRLLEEVPGSAGTRWSLRLDLGHPVLFDHACDHVPGMALIEALRQAEAAAGAAPGPLRSLEVRFLAFGELDRPTEITAGPAAESRELTASQGDRTLAVMSVVRDAAAMGGATC